MTLSSSVATSNFGACWTYLDTSGQDHVYFAANNGNGVMEVLTESVSLTEAPSSAPTPDHWTGTADTAALGVPAAQSEFNDGLSCKNSLSPFPTCGDKNGLVDPSPENPVTDAECSANGGTFYYDPAKAARACKAVPCQVSSAALKRVLLD